MAKSRSIFDDDTSSKDLKKAAKKVQKKTMENIPDNETGKEEKLMHLYVDTAHHKKAKINATLRSMKLGEYIQWLISNDKVSL